MIKVINADKISKCGDFIEIKFDFELDSSSVLPVKTYILGNTTYLIANNSTALNTTTNTNYIYNEGVWTKVLTKSTEPSTKSGNIYTENGDYNVVNNELTGINNVKVMVNLTVKPNAVIKDLSNNLQLRIKETIKTSLDLDVKEVNIRVKNIAPKIETAKKEE